MNTELENAIKDYLARDPEGPSPLLRLLKSDAEIDDISSSIPPGNKRGINFASGAYYVYRTEDGLKYALFHESTLRKGTRKLDVHIVRASLFDIFDSVTGTYLF